MLDDTTTTQTADAPKMVINDAAVLAVATAMAQAHHGEGVTDVGGYMQSALTLVAGLAGLKEFDGPLVVEAAEPPAVPADTEPVQEPVEGQPATGSGGGAPQSIQQPPPNPPATAQQGASGA